MLAVDRAQERGSHGSTLHLLAAVAFLGVCPHSRGANSAPSCRIIASLTSEPASRPSSMAAWRVLVPNAVVLAASSQCSLRNTTENIIHILTNGRKMGSSADHVGAHALLDVAVIVLCCTLRTPKDLPTVDVLVMMRLAPLAG